MGQREMQQQEATIAQNKTSRLPPKKEEHQELRRAYSEMSDKMEKLVVMSGSSSNPWADVGGTSITNASKASGGGDVEETARCVCCGVAEECTAAYIAGVRAAFCGDWLCGLCAEDVKERTRREPAGGVVAALGSHEAECRDFNATRLNPTLSLAGSMRGIARRSFDRRASTSSCQDRRRHLGAAASNAAAAAALTRSVSCDPWYLADVINNGATGDRCR